MATVKARRYVVLDGFGRVPVSDLDKPFPFVFRGTEGGTPGDPKDCAFARAVMASGALAAYFWRSRAMLVIPDGAGSVRAVRGELRGRTAAAVVLFDKEGMFPPPDLFEILPPSAAHRAGADHGEAGRRKKRGKDTGERHPVASVRGNFTIPSRLKPVTDKLTRPAATVQA